MNIAYKYMRWQFDVLERELLGKHIKWWEALLMPYIVVSVCCALIVFAEKESRE